MAYSVIALYELMKDPDNKGTIKSLVLDFAANRNTECTKLWMYSHRWTLSRHLWESDSHSQFDLAWKREQQFIITNYSFEDFLRHGSGKDVDEFAEILLIASVHTHTLDSWLMLKARDRFMGVDRTKDFIKLSKAT